MIGCIVVAAGYGSFRKRNGKPFPKVAESVRGMPMIVHPLRAAERAGIVDTVVVANPRDVGFVTAAIELGIRTRAIYGMPDIVVQPERRGSADAVHRAIPALRARGISRALITYGDMPQWSSGTFRILIASSRSHHVVTMVTVVRDQDYPALNKYGRVMRDGDGKIVRIIEADDPNATPDVLAIDRVNPSLWIWDLAWLESAIPTIPPFKKADGYGDELYMPPLIAMAVSEGLCVGEVDLSISESREAVGVNTSKALREIRRDLTF